MDNGASSYRRFLEGEKEAFDEIINVYSDGLTFFINRYVQNLAAAEDITIDVFTELIVHPRRYNFSVSLKTYLYMIGRSRALNYLKRQKRYTMVDIAEVEEWLADEKELEAQILADERKSLVNEGLKKLPTDMRIVVHLIYFEELSYEDAAKIMGKNRKQIDNLLYRAKSMLRTILQKEELLS
ncbi:MAG: sigma-70 family RNA polymerase sigma factor [Agathobacter sp.]|nr:sigma-70 family RNA polymerase sigma factor [Agathobacter sp.]